MRSHRHTDTYKQPFTFQDAVGREMKGLLDDWMIDDGLNKLFGVIE